MTLRQRRQLDGIVGDERRLDQVGLHELTEDLVDELAEAHGCVHLQTELAGDVGNFVATLAAQVHGRCAVLNGLKDGNALEGRLERERVLAPGPRRRCREAL